MDPVNESEGLFQRMLTAYSKRVQKYKDDHLQAEALKLIPVEELNIKATQKLSMLEDGDDISLEDLMLVELLHWFKHSFFEWVDAPKCDSCNQTTVSTGTNLSPTESESKWEATTVEGFFCSKCQRNVRFPRYNHPRKLIQTRQGRCGEWANCFTLFCYAMQYEARFVFDSGDHVWTEVFSTSQGQWVHCDPCEDAFDKPLMYEVGWKKKLSYVIAFSVFDVQDVTWRYTVNFDDVCKRRNRCREEFLEHVIWSLTEKLQEHLSKEDREQRRDRCFEEVICFLMPQVDDYTYEGRTSGSLAWRLARGEANISSQQNAYVFKLCPEEIQQKHFLVKYNCATDKYIRIFGDCCIETEGWNSWLFENQNMFRKLESDWKMTYLARTENSSLGSVTWMFDFEDSGLVIDKLKLCLHSETFETGKIKGHLYPNSKRNKPITFEIHELTSLMTEVLRGCTSFLLTVELSEGTGNNAWQHSQLFRQSLDSEIFPFKVELFFDQGRAADNDKADEKKLHP